MRRGPPYCELTGLYCLVPSRPFSRAPEAIRLAHLCQFWYGLCKGFSRNFLPPPRPKPGHLSVRRSSEIRSPCWLRNINLMSIDYAFRPCLRSRLTLSGFTCPRNPWAYGDTDFHRVNRYSSRHIHFLALHVPFRDGFTAPRTLSYRSYEPAASAPRLFPIIIGVS